MKARSLALIYLLFTLSGFAGLIYESIWSRYLKLLLGHSSYGQILTLMIFMGGLGVGSFIGGRWASKLEKPLWLYAGAEGLIGLGALIYHALFLGGQQMLLQALGALGLTGTPALIFKTLIATGLTMPWAIALGITFPALAIGLIRLSGDTGRGTLPWLYFSNSLGGACGILAASYALIPAYGTPGALILAGTINLFLAGSFYLLGKGESVPEQAPVAESELMASDTKLPIVPLLLGVSLLTGLSSFLYEIAWIRLLSLVIGSSSHSFDLMVAAFISGLAGGGLFARRLHNSTRHPLLILGNVHLLMGLAAALSLNLYQGLFELINRSHLIFQSTPEAYPYFSVFKYSLCLLLMFPASFFAGTTLPLISWTLLRLRGQSSHVGSVYGYNTLGAILGASFGGLVLMPLLQLKWTLLSGALIDVCLGLGLLALLQPGLTRLAAVGLSSLLVLLPGLLIRLDGFTLSSGRFRRHAENPDRPQNEIVTVRDGRTATISFHQTTERLTIKTNGKPDASVDLEVNPGNETDEGTQLALAMFPMSLMRRPYSAAMIGMGSGMTAHSLLGDPHLESLDLIEIEPVMAELAAGFKPFNQRVYDSPKVRLIFDDAKSYFFASGKRYDLIVSEPSNPWVSGVASLFSAEFYAYIRGFLKPEGTLVQWMHTYEFDDQLLLAILKALQNHFPEVAVYGLPSSFKGTLLYNDVLILASQRPIDFAERPELAAALPELGRLHRAPGDYTQHLRLVSSKTLQPLLARINPNSDFFPIVDNGAEKALYTKSRVQMFSFLAVSPLYYQSLFEPDFEASLRSRLEQRMASGELETARGQLSQMLAAPLQFSDPENITKRFYSLNLVYFSMLDYSEPLFEKYANYLEQMGLQEDILQFRLLAAVQRQDTESIGPVIDQMLSELQPAQIEGQVLRVMAIHCLRSQDTARLDKIVRQLALRHPEISEIEKQYLLSLMPESAQAEAKGSR